jgi:ribose transport system permease protein
MKKVIGVALVLLFVIVATAILNPAFVKPTNLKIVLRSAALYGILGIGAAFVIMGGGIDLSIGSVIGLVGVLLPLLLVDKGWSVPTTLLVVLVVTLLIGLGHGLLITKLRLQPFVVTLCGLLIYRSTARFLTGDQQVGFGSQFQDLREISIGFIPVLGDWEVPIRFLILVGVAAIAAVFVNRTVLGRYLLAIGRNEQAARYSGINTDNVVILSYVLCTVVAGGLGGVLLMLDIPAVQPGQQGNFYELYAIAAAVLGGCSLRGGEGSMVGVVIGGALIPVLENAAALLYLPDTLLFAILGLVILVGAVVDEVARRVAAARRRYKEAL